MEPTWPAGGRRGGWGCVLRIDLPPLVNRALLYKKSELTATPRNATEGATHPQPARLGLGSEERAPGAHRPVGGDEGGVAHCTAIITAARDYTKKGDDGCGLTTQESLSHRGVLGREA